MAYTNWKLTLLDHRVKSLALQGKKWKVLLSYMTWFGTTHMSSIVSLVLLAVVSWVEMFSVEHMGVTAESGINAAFTPIIILVLAFPFNVWAHNAFVRDENPYKFGHSFVSAVFPARFLHPTDKFKTKKFTFASVFSHWGFHVLAWLVYAVVIYAKSVAPAYKGQEKQQPTTSSSYDLSSRKRLLFNFWRFVTIATRLLSVSLLCYVYFEHWFEVRLGAIKPALLMMVPYILLLAVANLGLQLAFFGRSVGTSLLSIFLPNDFGRCGVSRAGLYIVLNCALNLALHLLVWLTMTFYCWDCAKAIDAEFSKLSVCFPVAIGFWVFDLLLTLLTWRLCLRENLEKSPESSSPSSSSPTFSSSSSSSGINSGGRVNKAYEESPATSWPNKESSVTTKF